MSLRLDPFQLQVCVSECIDDHHAGRSHDELFEHLKKRLFYQYAPYIVGCRKISKHCMVYYSSLNELLILFRNDKEYHRLTPLNNYCSVWDIVVKGRCRAEALAQIPPGIIYRSNIRKEKSKNPNSAVQWIRSGDMLQREVGTQCNVGVDKDTWILEYHRGAMPTLWDKSSLYRHFAKHLYSYNIFPCVWQSCQSNFLSWQEWFGGNPLWRAYRANWG